jgi:hypothetical protein
VHIPAKTGRLRCGQQAAPVDEPESECHAVGHELVVARFRHEVDEWQGEACRTYHGSGTVELRLNITRSTSADREQNVRSSVAQIRPPT